PVENASFMPWLAGTALLHSTIVVEKRDTLKAWTVLLAILTFSLSLLGTFLVRSGVLTSVHAFASDPTRGVFILLLLVVAIGGSLALFAWRAPAMQGGGVFAPISREGGLVLNNLLLATATATVLLGTLYPLILDVLDAGKISVGPPFYNATFVPLMVPLFVAMPIGAQLAWKRGDLKGVMRRLWAAASCALLAVAFVLLLTDLRGTLALLGFALAAWLVAGSLADLAARIGLFRLAPARSLARLKGLPLGAFAVVVAHMGLGILIAGVTAVSTGRAERILVMAPGDRTTLAGYEVRFDGVEPARGPNYVAQRGTFVVTSGGAPVVTLHSEKRSFPVERQTTSEAGIDTGLTRDLYMVLGDPAPGRDGAWTVRLYVNPLASWIWLGAAVMALGGACSLFDRRLRVGAPKPASSRAAPLAGPA
ncbi:MAG: cytochrome c biogenesis protein CcsA, partial [Geminicoccaceae bacterium]|nr:cytochrome c biogenesis protein CcsA [Geminicoccaceae bacterium]